MNDVQIKVLYFRSHLNSSRHQDLINTFDAFNRHDIESVMNAFADDCVFYAVAGDEKFGTKIEGADAISTAFSGVWAAMAALLHRCHQQCALLDT